MKICKNCKIRFEGEKEFCSKCFRGDLQNRIDKAVKEDTSHTKKLT